MGVEPFVLTVVGATNPLRTAQIALWAGFNQRPCQVRSSALLKINGWHVIGVYRFLKFKPTKLRTEAANCVQISEIVFFTVIHSLEVIGTDTTYESQFRNTSNKWRLVPLHIHRATNPSGHNPTVLDDQGHWEGPPQATDGDVSTKWLDFNRWHASCMICVLNPAIF